MNKLYIAAVAISLITGCGKNEDDETFARKTGDKFGQTLTDFVSGVGKGIDEKMTVKIELGKDIKASGITKTIAKLYPVKETISVYLLSAQPFKNKLIAKAINDKEQEIGRSVVEAEFTKDDAKYITFKFSEELDTQLVKKYTLNIRK